MTSRSRLSHQRNRVWAGVSLALVLSTGSASALVIPQSQLTFKDADIQIVIEEVARLTGTTFLFDPARVQGKITLLPAGEGTPAQALELLRSALALQAYLLVARPEGMWIVPQEAAGAGIVVRVVRLTYVDAEDVAVTLSWAAPPGVRIAPFYPTNSVVISGPEAAVDQMVDIIRRR